MTAIQVLDVTKSHNGAALPHPPNTPVAASLGARDTDSHGFTIPATHVYQGHTLELQDGRLNPGLRIESIPAYGESGGRNIDVHWFFDGSVGQAFICYRITATALPLSEAVPEHKVRGFLPSTSGLHFTNNFSNVTISFAVGPVTVSFQGANGGACGGMAFLTRDLFEAGFLVPAFSGNAGPASGPLYDAIMNRLRDSFNLPAGPQRYLELMDPTLPDAGVALPPPLPHRRGRGEILREAWRQLRADIDNDQLSAIGLVLVKSADPAQITNNHQVLAYGYNMISDREGLIFLYDPNFPDKNLVTIAFKVESDDRVSFLHSPYPSLVGFFRNDYTHVPASRPALGDTKKAAFKAANGSFVTAENGGGGVVTANRSQASTWETFQIERAATGPLRSGELVNLRAHNGQYVAAENRGGGAVNANRWTPLSWERFVIDQVGSNIGDIITDGGSVQLRTDGDHYLVANAGVVSATGIVSDAKTRFIFKPLP